MVPVVYGLQQSLHLSDLSTIQGQHKQDPDLWSYILLLKVKIPWAITEPLWSRMYSKVDLNAIVELTFKSYVPRTPSWFGEGDGYKFLTVAFLNVV